ncbi:S-methyl-5'-thioadenosine phosphorylase [Sphaceloma murrayae]|uniref:S-methyl-5'-thioadenosine phosphorylase n=1 Tax=Sphaceloma murrayae TaxID=2082308 RepID=A0A2K1QU40_9PEZI|nr:S-methyl-5'-thioadenosine phosphorylase [Sphaceloma murrayae]
MASIAGKKRPQTLDGFFKSPDSKRHKPSDKVSSHATYPFPVPHLPTELTDALGFAPETEGKTVNDQPDLDLLYFQPYVPKAIERALFRFLRQELFFYRVQYKIKRGPVETQINTPRYTTVFGLDETSKFAPDGSSLVDAATKQPVPPDRYKTCKPRPIPECLDFLRRLTEGSTGETYNFCLVNYYASGSDSISYHSDDERFLGNDPAIASFSLGARRDFLMKHKPMNGSKDPPPGTKPLKLPLASGDMILMRGRTQSNWLHSIPKRKGGEADLGRINITFRKAMVKGGTENYYQYNVGTGHPFRWDENKGEMVPWKPA